MSGIFGLLRFDGESVSSADLERMAGCLRHRGPDRRSLMVDGPLGLGHCLMRVNREDRFDAQPLRDETAGLVLVADCRLDNREELARSFSIDAEALALMPDSALILRAYRQWGVDCVERLLGDFAFALWDARRGELMLARDPMGERCMFFHRNAGFLAFASEVKALWAVPDMPQRLSETQIGRYLAYQFPTDDGVTFFEGVTYAPGGHVVHVRADGAARTTRYWEPHADPTHVGRDEAYYIATYRRLLAEAVDCRIRRTIAAPALLLSAGFDSGAIAGLAQPRLAEQGRKLLAFSSVLPEDYRGPHSSARPFVEACRRVMPHLDIRYFTQTNENLFTGLERSAAAADAPADGVFYIRDALYRRAAQAGARLVMDGFGGDLTINPRLGNVLAHFLRRGRLLLFAREFAAQLRVGDQSFRVIAINTAKQLIPSWVVVERARRLLRGAGRRLFIAPQFLDDLVRRKAVDLEHLAVGRRPNRSPHERMLRHLRFWTIDNRRWNANEAAAFGLELTRPFCDRRIVEFALAIPEELWIKNGRRRYLARKALADIYPPEYDDQEARQDTIEPVLQWGVTSVLPELSAELERMSTNPVLSRYLDFDALRRACADWNPEHPDSRSIRRAFCLAKFVEATSRANRAPTPRPAPVDRELCASAPRAPRRSSRDANLFDA
jgi:asparagine synthase (glutamine-hydrolysing)